MLAQAGQHMSFTATNLDQVMAQQHSQDAAIFHLSPATNQRIHIRASANFSPMPVDKEARLKRLQTLKRSLENEATSSIDPRSEAYAKLQERTLNPELRSQNFLEIPVTREGLVGGRGESSSWEINEKREEISAAENRIDNLRSQLNNAQHDFQNASEANEGQYLDRILEIQTDIASERNNMRRLQSELNGLIAQQR